MHEPLEVLCHSDSSIALLLAFSGVDTVDYLSIFFWIVLSYMVKHTGSVNLLFSKRTLLKRVDDTLDNSECSLTLVLEVAQQCGCDVDIPAGSNTLATE